MIKRGLFLLAIFFCIFSTNSFDVNAAAPLPDANAEAGVAAPLPPDPADSSAMEEAWGPKYDQSQIDSYRYAVETDNCATPSLECLVHQTSRFVAIEWVNSILYPGSKGLTDPNAPVTDAGSNNVLSNQGGFVGGITYLMGEMYRYPVARTSVYVADVLESAHIITPAYAQGLGFASLNPVLDLWKVFRNVSYMLFVFIFIVLGFMIMFRQKIGGQTAVTAQQAIPNVVASLIFVTFSYAIAGFLIDLMYLLMFMIIGIFGQTAPGVDGGIIDFNILELMGRLFQDVSGFSNNVDIVTQLMGSMVNNETLGNTLGIVGGVTLSLVLAVAILIGTFKLFFELLKSYATVVLSVVTAPLLLLGGAFPGKNVFGPWVKNIVANLSAFPVVLMVVILFYQFTAVAPTAGGFIPPFLLGRGQSGAITTLMGLAIILALPEIVKDIKKNLGATEGFGTMIFNAAGARAKESWGRTVKAPGQIYNAQPFGTGDGMPFRTTGTESALERFIIGSRAQRKSEYDYQRQRALHGQGATPTKEGGLYGMLVNDRRARLRSQQETGSGAGANVNINVDAGGNVRRRTSQQIRRRQP
ncbi:hypothetical protein KA111_02350 [Candidatus Woesebacteria bacterium]|nr:hypothetical protein [Candidatus Woesebacteria bacterium]